MTISVFSNYQIYNIPQALRLLAEQIERGDDYIRCFVCLERPNGAIDYRAFGEDFPKTHALGLLTAFQALIIKDSGILDDE